MFVLSSSIFLSFYLSWSWIAPARSPAAIVTIPAEAVAYWMLNWGSMMADVLAIAAMSRAMPISTSAFPSPNCLMVGRGCGRAS